jgi:hypothetical protein
MTERFYRLLMEGIQRIYRQPFNLGNMFLAHGRETRSQGTLRTATRAILAFVEAYNVGDLLDDPGRSAAARLAVRVVPSGLKIKNPTAPTVRRDVEGQWR